MKKERNLQEPQDQALNIPVVSTSYSIKDDVCEICGDFLDTENRFYCFKCSLDFCGGC